MMHPDGFSSYLVVCVVGFFLSSGLMLVFGQRNKSSNILMSFALYAGLLAASSFLISSFGYRQPEFGTLFAVFCLGIPVIVYSKSWNLIGKVTFSLTIQAALGFVMFVGWKSITANSGILELSVSLVLLVLVASAMLLMVVQAFELTDVICRIHWRRLARPSPTKDYFPKVSLHVPAYNEPPEMVIATLDALAKIDYPNYEVIMIDNNTKDESLWKPVRAHCEKLGFKFIHLENWPGFKSGALNYATTKTDPETEIIGIIDADYIVEPHYLRELVGQFSNSKMAFVQTPQDYRDFDTSNRYLMALYHAYQYFFKLSMASRNERNGIIFTGTMGLIRKRVLEQVGGWDEWCITEDAEIALKILDKGYESVFIDETYGRGLMPLDFESLKKQRFRWAFGGMQVLRMHWRKLLPWRDHSDPEGGNLSMGQKMDFWAGGLQWLNDPITFLFTLFLFGNGVAYILINESFINSVMGIGIFVPFVFILTNLTRTLWGLRLRLRCTYRQAFQALLMLLSLTLVVSQACVLGLTKKAGVFLRTPKQKSDYGLLKVLSIVDKELVIAGLCVVTIVALLMSSEYTVTVWVLASLLSWQAFIYGSAVFASYWSYRSGMPAYNASDKHETEAVLAAARWVAGSASPGLLVAGIFVGAFGLFFI